MKTKVLDRFLGYVKIHTTSDPTKTTFPSTERQFKLANLLVQEFKNMGINDAVVDKKCVVYATLPSNIQAQSEKKIPTICFNAHMDTSPAEPGENVHPILHDFTGEDIVINKDLNIIVEANSIPDANQYIGTQIISSDGTTLLGADDKAGVAEIMSAMEYLMENSSIPHGDIKIVFSPDEEIGTGAKAVEIESLGANWGYTIDGGVLGELESECFNAANGTIHIKGYNVHPGSAFGKMQNALRAIPEILQIFPQDTAPETTKGNHAYYHPFEIKGDVNDIKIEFIIRSFDGKELDSMIQTVSEKVQKIQIQFSNLEISCEIEKGYKNMREIIDLHPHILDIARLAMKRAGITPKEHPIRGGTDGAQFSFRGLPTPNIFTGGMNFHSKKEICSVMAMEKAVETIVNIISIVAEENLSK